MPRHRALGRQRLARGDARIQRVLQQLVLALQFGQPRGAAFGVVHRQPGQRGVAPHRQFGHRQHRALALDARLRAGRTRLALGAVGHLLHQADALHRHEVGRGAEARRRRSPAGCPGRRSGAGRAAWQRRATRPARRPELLRCACSAGACSRASRVVSSKLSPALAANGRQSSSQAVARTRASEMSMSFPSSQGQGVRERRQRPAGRRRQSRPR